MNHLRSRHGTLSQVRVPQAEYRCSPAPAAPAPAVTAAVTATATIAATAAVAAACSGLKQAANEAVMRAQPGAGAKKFHGISMTGQWLQC